MELQNINMMRCRSKKGYQQRLFSLSSLLKLLLKLLLESEVYYFCETYFISVYLLQHIILSALHMNPSLSHVHTDSVSLPTSILLDSATAISSSLRSAIRHKLAVERTKDAQLQTIQQHRIRSLWIRRIEEDRYDHTSFGKIWIQ